MGKLKERIAAIGRGLAGSVRDYPLETLLGLVYFLIYVFDRTISVKIPGAHPEGLLSWFFPHIVLLFTLHRFSKGRPAVKVLYILSWFLWIPLLLWGHNTWGWTIGIADLLAVILLILGDRRMDDEPYGRHILRTAGKAASGFLVAGLLILIVSAVLSSVNFLFALHLRDEWFTWPIVFIALVILPLLCCHFLTGASSPVGTAPSRLLTIAIDYILSPALVIYTLILYVYCFLILVNWKLPEGGVAYLVLSFLVVGLACHLLRLQVQKPHFEWFYKAFPAIAAAPLALLWVGIIRRVSEYGFTETRIYLVALAALVTLFVGMLVFRRSRRFQLMTLILAGAAVLLTFIPGIRARDFGLRSQQARLERLLPLVLKDGKPLEAADFGVMKTDSTRMEAFRSAIPVWHYLRNEMDKDAFQARYGEFGDFQAVENARFDAERDLLVEGEWIVLPGRVDLGKYRHYVPRDGYHYAEDGEAAVFFADGSKRDTLLVCPIRERLEAFKAARDTAARDTAGAALRTAPRDERAVAPENVLIYSNERYMAVFEKIRPCYGGGIVFETGRSTLYAKDAAR